ncbi:MAG: DUF1028 domain-containing protein [Sphingobacteriales bacterium]|jgi:uncharacterized Ntn-hydrolase superfamily protein|nr:DUF1028 domain-containing protein [Sphingobacteriales bacterium]MBK7527207.1 DUF1028 domain-containing protein [Sphingobacteriales bacterium]MBP9141001.1 DUF1028 domain-containing protein [Chitinophagales bacterium]MDA0198628.1 DUF1028 domain-containing protein [Bacteroidota bacterium]
MLKFLLNFLTFLSFILILPAQAQDTFSIIAVDTLTGEVGGAGASCIDDSAISGGVVIINDILPNRGGIHTQSYWVATNQINARKRMEEGKSPDEIIAWLQANDSQNNPAIRQYGIVDFDSLGKARSAGFTGISCFDYKNHIVGPTYAIQGNILLGQAILDSIEARFLNTSGTLSDRLMAALQGANVPGADTRCLEDGISSLSSFIRVAKPTDEYKKYWLEIIVPNTPDLNEPIDILQELYDQWKTTLQTPNHPDKNSKQPVLWVYPNPATEQQQHFISIAANNLQPNTNHHIEISNNIGQVFWKNNCNQSVQKINIQNWPNGVYFVQLFAENQPIKQMQLVKQ